MATKKGFSAQAAAAFLTPSAAAPSSEAFATTETASPVELTTFRAAHERGEETRTRRCSTLMKPSVFQRASLFARSRRISFNALVEQCIEEYLENHAED